MPRLMPSPTLACLLRVFLRIGLLSFGGPAAQIALMHRELVVERAWLAEREFLDATAYAMLLPGPEAMQIATYVGWRLRGVGGGLVSGGMFILPGAALMGLVATFYVALVKIALIQAAFLGIKAAVLFILLQAVLRLSRHGQFGALGWAIAGGAMTLLSLGAPFPLILILAYALGMAGVSPHQGPAEEALKDARGAAPTRLKARALLMRQGLLLILGIALWLLPLSFLTGALGELAAFFARLAAVSFGGAYAGLTYMVQDLTTQMDVLTPAQIIDGLGLAETTPGPLILVTQFVGHIAAERAGLWGLWGGLVALWMIFVPSFVLIFALGPFLPYLSAHPRLRGGARALSAAVIGLIALLALWFARSVLLASDGGLDGRALMLLVLAGGLLFWARLSLPLTLLICALGGLVCALIPL